MQNIETKREKYDDDDDDKIDGLLFSLPFSLLQIGWLCVSDKCLVLKIDIEHFLTRRNEIRSPTRHLKRNPH